MGFLPCEDLRFEDTAGGEGVLCISIFLISVDICNIFRYNVSRALTAGLGGSTSVLFDP